VFVRFAGCNLWSGREQDRASAICRFCDTDFVGVDGLGGGRFADAAALVAAVEGFWGTTRDQRFVVLTGASRCCRSTTRWSRRCMRRVLHRDREQWDDRGASGHRLGVHQPQAGSQVVQRSGQELKLVWPQAGIDPAEVEGWDFANHLLQPLDDPRAEANREACIAMVMERPRWRLTLQTHKMLGLR
jgi:organic radical activating enzyme